MISSRGFSRSLFVGLTVGAFLAIGSCGAPADRPADEAGEEEGGAGGTPTAKGGSGGKKGSGGSGGMLPSQGGNGSSAGGNLGSGSGGNGGSQATGGSGSGGSGPGSGGTMGGAPDARPDTAAPDTGGGGTPTFTELYDTVFGVGPMSKQSCWGAKCHNPGMEDKIDVSTKMKAYTTLLTQVKPGNPAGSGLIMRLESADVKKRMPLDKPPLDPAVIAKVKAWIMAGAKND
jgi:hypothetical protein